MKSAFRKALGYTTRRNIGLWVFAYAVVFLAGAALMVTESTTLFAFLLSLAVMCWWPIARDLAPVCYCVIVKGRWPDGVNINTPLN